MSLPGFALLSAKNHLKHLHFQIISQNCKSFAELAIGLYWPWTSLACSRCGCPGSSHVQGVAVPVLCVPVLRFLRFSFIQGVAVPVLLPFIQGVAVPVLLPKGVAVPVLSLFKVWLSRFFPFQGVAVPVLPSRCGCPGSSSVLLVFKVWLSRFFAPSSGSSSVLFHSAPLSFDADQCATMLVSVI